MLLLQDALEWVISKMGVCFSQGWDMEVLALSLLVAGLVCPHMADQEDCSFFHHPHPMPFLLFLYIYIYITAQDGTRAFVHTGHISTT